MSTRRSLLCSTWIAVSLPIRLRTLVTHSSPVTVPFITWIQYPHHTIHPLTNTYTSATERDTELLLHTKSLQKTKNKGLQTFWKAVESIIIMPSASFETQIKENNKEIALKKLSNEIILGKTTENSAMELDAEGGASFEQLQELIKKECDKRDKKYRFWEQKYNKLQESIEHSPP